MLRFFADFRLAMNPNLFLEIGSRQLPADIERPRFPVLQLQQCVEKGLHLTPAWRMIGSKMN